MSYEHYGKFADVWKHLLLCTALELEHPSRYTESNSAFARYLLSSTPEQRHGIFRFLERGKSVELLSQSSCYQLELESSRQPGGPSYLGSPGLAIRLLVSRRTSFTFFDLDQAALQSIEQFAFSWLPSITVDLRQQDSLVAFREMFFDLESSFLFFDPYDAFTPNAAGDDYFQLFLEANERGAKGMLWYGFDDVSQRRRINKIISSRVAQSGGAPILDAVSSLRSIKSEGKLENPGVFGCGMMCANLSEEAERTIEEISRVFPTIYRGSMLYEDQSGELETMCRRY